LAKNVTTNARTASYFIGFADADTQETSSVACVVPTLDVCMWQTARSHCLHHRDTSALVARWQLLLLLLLLYRKRLTWHLVLSELQGHVTMSKS